VKTLVMIIGASATGKSTLTRTLAGNGAEEHEVELNVTEKGRRSKVKSPYVLGAKIAVAGNLKAAQEGQGSKVAPRPWRQEPRCWTCARSNALSS
jgi:ABC-type nitrate/sulfonate/bicarbonate transport system ATPase subunit